MSLVFGAALAASAVTLPVCSWDRPGHNVFRGDTVAAVDRYDDIPADVRAALKARMAERRYDEVATIRRDSIEGRYTYSGLRDMHFGRNQVCKTVTRDKWAPEAVERGLVYCESGHCLIVPTVCRNLSRVDRGAAPASAAGASPGAAGNTGPALASAPPTDELVFDPPGAGPATGSTAGSAAPFGPELGSSAGPSSSFTMLATTSGSAPGFGPLPAEAPPAGNWRPGGDAGWLNVPAAQRSATDTFPGGEPLLPPRLLLPAPSPPTTSPVPEPQQWLILLCGLGWLAAAARRRHAAARTAGTATSAST